MLSAGTVVGKRFQRGTTLKTLLLPIAAYIIFVYFSYKLRFKI